MTTRAIQILNKKKVIYKIIRYKHEEKGALFASQAIHFPLEKTVKTLVADTGHNSYLLALIAGNHHLSTKKLAKAHGVKRVAMADPTSAERITGFKIGGISPIGTRQTLPVIMEAGLFKFEQIAINGGQRGVMLIIAPSAIQNLLDARIGHIVKT